MTLVTVMFWLDSERATAAFMCVLLAVYLCLSTVLTEYVFRPRRARAAYLERVRLARTAVIRKNLT